jgi:hypothetical protein
MSRRKPKVDVTVENHGSLFLFTPHTQAAKDWVSENVGLESWQWLGTGFAVEHRFALDLADGMLADGLEVR